MQIADAGDIERDGACQIASTAAHIDHSWRGHIQPTQGIGRANTKQFSLRARDERTRRDKQLYPHE